MELLTAINRILPVLGEHPVTSLDTKHPTIAIVTEKVKMKVDDILIPGYWFNESVTKLYQDSEQGIAMPADTLSFLPDRQYPGVVRGAKLFNTATNSFLWSAPVTGKLIVRLPFNQLPESAAQYIMYSVMVASYVTDIGLEADVQMWQQEAAAAERRMMSEHLRNKRYSTARGSRFQRYANSLIA